MAASNSARRRLPALLACLGLAAGGPLAAAPPSRLRLTVPAAPVAPGQTASLKVELLGEDRQPSSPSR